MVHRLIFLAGSRRIIDMQIHSVGIDLGKTTFHLVALSAAGAVAEEVYAEAAHHLYREPADFVDRDGGMFGSSLSWPDPASTRPRREAHSSPAEAVDRQNMRFVPIKTDDQLDLHAMHRVRDRLVARRTCVINQLRAFLLERGMVFAKTPFKLKQAMPEILENAEANLTPRMRNLVGLLWSEWKDLDQQIVAMNAEVEQIASADPACQRLRQIPGVGPLVVTAIVAAIGNGAAFHKGREFSSWLGLVPRQYSTGGKARLFGIKQAR
jgi:transposase